MDKIVLYHSNCADGFSGAWVARKKFGDEADYIGVFHKNPPPDDLNDKDVYIIDFSYPAEETKRLLEQTKSLTVIDHHITVKEVVESVPDHLYAVDNSGAVLAWKYFFKDEEVPLFLQYVEDGDLWNFKLNRSEEFSAFLKTLDYDFEKWDEVIKKFEDKKEREKYLDYGTEILEYQKKVIEDIMKNAEEVSFEGYSAMVVNSSMFGSQVGNAMVKKGYDIGIIWSHIGESTIRVSLRSDKEGKVNVGNIAAKFGGGGHKSAAGFIIDESQSFPWKKKNT